MKTKLHTWQQLFAGLYTWMVSIFSGLIVLDIVYARIVAKAVEPAQAQAIFSKAADFLLWIGMLVVPAALAAVISSWARGPARNLFLASGLFLLAEFVAPMLLFPLFQMTHIDTGFNIGAWIRLTVSTLSSLLALLGLWKLYSSKG